MRITLPILDARIDARVAGTLKEHPYWPCQKGCDACCRSLPHLPQVSAPEWERMRAAVDALPEATVAEVKRRMEASEGASKVVCPLLDEAEGACRIYEARPIACRTYGFYTERDAGLHCSKVTAAVEAHADPASVIDSQRGSQGEPTQSVIWGNGEALARELDTLGERRSIAHWWSER